jgi:hypothetical protein
VQGVAGASAGETASGGTGRVAAGSDAARAGDRAGDVERAGEVDFGEVDFAGDGVGPEKGVAVGGSETVGVVT